MSSLLQERGAAALDAPGAGLVSIAGLLVCCAPLLVLTVRGWANAVLYLGAIFSIVMLWRGTLPRLALPAQDRRWVRLLIAACVAPIVTTFISAVLRHYFEQSQFDAPSRFLLAIPVFLFVLRSGWPVGRVMQWVLPLGLAGAAAYLAVLGQDPKWPAVRVTTRVVDPLVFGYLSLAFGMMCLASIVPREWRGQGRWGVVLRLLACGLGLGLSILSWSRSGWLAVPIVIGLWAYWHWGRGHPVATAAALVAPLVLCVLAYFTIPTVTTRVNETVTQVEQYPWHGVLTHETSAGYRITFLRLGADIFSRYPWSGVGDTQRVRPHLPDSMFPYASPDSVSYAFASGFHNQIVSNAVRNGLGGLLSTVALLFVPLAICIRALRRSGPAGLKDAFMGVAYCTCMVVTSLTTEIVDLKFAASFYAVMIAALCGAALRRRGPEEG